MSSRAHRLAAALLASVAMSATTARAETPATFALIVGVNKPIDPGLAALRYADDDAARYLDLFRSLGARTYLLARLDENTRRLHPQAAAEALTPNAADLERVVATAAQDVQRARAAGVPTVFYLVYAGHGNARDGEGYLTLEDARLTGKVIVRDVLDRIGANQNHLIVDACYSYFLVFGRGPTADQRRPVRGFVSFEEVLPAAKTGLLFSTSSARESHEWEAYQAGVFSHEVRSGLFGAADADGDGQVSYREIASFVQRANEAIPNERFRPDVYARPPTRGEVLVDLRAAASRRLRLDGAQHGHFILEDSRGVRLAEFHTPADGKLTLLRGATLGPTFLRRVSDGSEWRLGSGEDLVALDDLPAGETQVAMRGAAHEAFGAIFSLPFDANAAGAYRFRRIELPRVWLGWSPPKLRRVVAGGSLLGVGVAAAASGLGLTLAGRGVRAEAPVGESNLQIVQRNERIAAYDAGAAALYGIAGAAAIIGSVLLAWPDRPEDRPR